jgi:WD40 repeat protein
MNKIILLLLISLFLSCFGYSQKAKDYSVYPTESADILDICFSKYGEVIGIPDNNVIKVFKTNTQELIAEFKNGHTSQIQTIDISKDSLLLISGGKDSSIVIWDFINQVKLKTLTFQGSIVTSIKISPDNKFFVSGGIDKICIYDIKNDKLIRKINNNTITTCVAFSPDGKIVATSNSDKSITVFEVETGKLLAKLQEHKSWVRNLTFSNDGTKLISCGDDSKIIRWNTSDRNDIKLLSKSRYGYNWLLSVDFYLDNRSYAFGDFNGNAVIITPFGRYNASVKSPINKVLFKPYEEDCLKIAVATREKGVLFIDAKNMKTKGNR